ncbi:MFS transporter [Streptomyces sp. NBC_00257]|uniref:MFS transporter n=1 Tax=unclassified Streptomyces TaxID=2593676 RepID=UPI00225ACA7F|nr:MULTISPECIES: MFS transporter [unclassified Streptomyces]MCX4866485.1 MFS transporter [Streptomyces sp. NBC_00906]MCX4897723.1 MFS transporter [Streptomyces sp. NBC_00892]MCX5431021.1 MFS transporter [Streptomyces sp. NBC_00062]
MTTAEPGPGHGAAESTGMRGSDIGGDSVGSTRTAAPARKDAGAADTSAPRTGPSRRARAERLLRHPVTIATAAAAVTHLLWVLFFANSGGDLAAQDAWAEFVGRHPGTAYNLAWYGGMHPVSYSVVSPYLMSLLGVRTTMMIAGTVSAALTALILVRVRAVRNPLACSLAGAFAYLCNALSGRVTFGLGMMFAVGATAAVFCWPYRWRYKRWAKAAVAAPLAGLATASSPVAGLFLGVVAAALFLNKRRPGAYALGLAPVAVVALSAWLFPFSGTQPMSVATLSLPFIFSVLVFVLVPRDWKTVRTAAAVYGVGTLLTYFIDSQIGSNITRMAMLFAGVVFLAALPYTVPRSRRWYALIIAFTGLNFWIGFKGVDDIVRTAPTASWARELAPLVNELQQVGAERGRVEVVPASSHREASALAPYVNLARGWNRQADMKRNPLFYDDTLDSANYRQWLDRWAVHYVVLPTGTPDSSGAVQEAQLVDGGLPYLKPVWSDANWRLFEVDGPVPLADPPATVDRAEAGELTIHVKTPGRILIRIPYSRWLAVVDSEGRGVERPQETEASKQRTDENTPRTFVNTNGCLFKVEEDADGDEWTELLAPRPGVYRLAAPYQLSPGTPCPEEMR